MGRRNRPVRRAQSGGRRSFADSGALDILSGTGEMTSSRRAEAPHIGIGRLVLGDVFAPLQKRLIANAPRFGYRADRLIPPRHIVVTAEHLRELQAKWSPSLGADSAERVAAMARGVALRAGWSAVDEAIEVHGVTSLRHSGGNTHGRGRTVYRLDALVAVDPALMGQLAGEQQAFYDAVGMPRSDQAAKLETLRHVGLTIPLVGVKLEPANYVPRGILGLVDQAATQDMPGSFTLAPFDAIDETLQRL